MLGRRGNSGGRPVMLPLTAVEGTTIGTYRIARKLGEGGMGVVYLAEHTLLGRRAAIKVLLPDLCAHREIVQRFFNEARAVTQIADPGIVQVFDFGYHTNGSAYIVMELLEGEPMDKRLERIGRFSPMDSLRLMRLVCTSLAAAHAKGVVHRDLKPENLYLIGDPAVTGGERPKVLDFGIAKLSGDEPGKLKTRTGMVMGTPVYMSPEQCRGAGEVDHRSDIYSIGCVFMTMLTGRPPFDAEGSGELIAMHLREPPPRAASRLPGLPEMFDQILQRCLAKQPAERFQHMGELVATLAHAEQLMLHTSTPTIATPLPAYLGSGLTPPGPMRTPTPAPMQAAPTPPPLQPPAGRKRVLAIAGGVVLAGGIAAAVLLADHTSDAPGTAAAAPATVTMTPIDASAVPVAKPAPIDAPPPIDAAPPRADAAIDAPPPKPKPVHHSSHHAGSGSSASPAAGSDLPIPTDRGD